MLKKIKVNFKKMAELLLFNLDGFKKYIIDNNVEFRKNKNISDINNASKKAIKNGNAKIENEIGMLEIYLGMVFKSLCVPQNK